MIQLQDMEKIMLVNIDAEVGMVPELREQISYIIDEISGFGELEYLQEYQWEDLKYNLELLPALKRVLAHYSIPSDWEAIDLMTVEIDHDLTETETGLSFDEAYVLAGGDFEDV